MEIAETTHLRPRSWLSLLLITKMSSFPMDRGAVDGKQVTLDPPAETETEDHSMPIAVVGIGCRFPGDASSPDKLWELLAEGRSALSTMPKDRLNIDAFYHPQAERHGSVSPA